MQALSYPRLGRASIALAALTLCGVASAASVQYDFVHADQSTTWVSNEPLTKFDPTLGTLTSVDFYFGGTMVTRPYMTNNGSTTTVTNTTTGHYTITGTGMSPTPLYANDSTPYQTQATVAPNQTVTQAPYTLAFANAVRTYTNSSTLAQFMGPGSISLMFAASAGSQTAGDNGNANGGNITTANGTGFVRYNYTAAPVPEPASMAALGIGVVALVRRRKAAKR